MDLDGVIDADTKLAMSWLLGGDGRPAPFTVQIYGAQFPA